MQGNPPNKEFQPGAVMEKEERMFSLADSPMTGLLWFSQSFQFQAPKHAGASQKRTDTGGQVAHHRFQLVPSNPVKTTVFFNVLGPSDFAVQSWTARSIFGACYGRRGGRQQSTRGLHAAPGLTMGLHTEQLISIERSVWKNAPTPT